LKISIIIPILNDADLLKKQLQSLQAWRAAGHEIIVVDGGSEETITASDREMADRFLSTNRGRALQMNEGARLADGDILLFLHADSGLPENAGTLIERAMEDCTASWGRFDVRLSSERLIFRIIGWAINIRSYITGVATGDQGLFVRRSVFEQLAGYAPIPLMEDVEISKRLRRITRPIRLKGQIVTSSRRWEQHGVFSTVFLMWWLRLLYFLGVSPEKLIKKYYK